MGVCEDRLVRDESNTSTVSNTNRRLIESLRESAEAHEKAAALFERLRRPGRAAQHRADATEARTRADQLEGPLGGRG
jgi:hypothetical protein